MGRKILTFSLLDFHGKLNKKLYSAYFMDTIRISLKVDFSIPEIQFAFRFHIEN